MTPEQFDTLREEILREEQALKSLGLEIDRDMRTLFQNSELRTRDRDEFNRRRNELIEKKRLLGLDRTALAQKKRLLNASKQVVLQEQKKETGSSNDALLAVASENSKKQAVLVAPAVTSAEVLQQPEQTTQLPQLGPETENSNEPVVDTALAEQAASLGTALAADSAQDASAQQGAAEVLAGQVVEAGITKGTQLAESWFDQFGKARIDLKLDDEFRVSSYEFDYFMPYYNSQSATAFMQLGFRNWSGRDILNLGLGYRHFNRGWMFGANAFIDSDLSLGHQRGSLGLEAMTNYVKGYSNIYMPLSDWKETGGGLEAQAAAGVDVGVEVQVGWVPGLSLSVEYFQWFGDHVDVAGGFEQDINAEAFDELGEDPEGLTLGVEYRPIPLVGVSVERTVGDEQTRNTTLGIDLTWNFDAVLSKQLRFVSAETVGSIETMREAFVERESNIVLSYRESGSGSGLTITLSDSYSVVEMQQLPITAKVDGPSPVVSLQWSGSGESLLDDLTSLTPTFTAGYWSSVASKNVYHLKLTVTDSFGREASAHTEIDVQEDPGLQPIITFTDGTSPLTSLTLVHDDTPFQLDCIVQSRRNPAGRQVRSGLSSQNSYLWEGDTVLLNEIDIANPMVDPKEPVSSYQLTLTVHLEGEVGSETLPVTITPADSGLVWEDTKSEIDSNGTVTKTLAASSFQIEAKSQAGSDGKIDYRIEGISGVASVSGDGTVSLDGAAGTVQVVATQAASNDGSYGETEIDYRLDVELVQPYLTWQDNSVETTKQVSRVYENDGFTYQVQVDTDSTGTVSYSTQSADVSVDGTNGEVTFITPGTVSVIDAEVPADGIYKSATNHYELTLDKGSGTPLTAKKSSIKLDIGDTYDAETNTKGGNGGGLSYTSENDQVVAMAPDGTATAVAFGSTQIHVTESESTYYQEQTATFTADVAAPKLDWPKVHRCEIHEQAGNVAFTVEYSIYDVNGDPFEPSEIEKIKLDYGNRFCVFEHPVPATKQSRYTEVTPYQCPLGSYPSLYMTVYPKSGLQREDGQLCVE